MAAKEGADLAEPLRLVDAALELLPEHPYVLETRGQILLKMGRYRESITDLEKSLARISESSLQALIYPSLIKAYESLGLTDMAKKYRQQAELNASLKSGQ